MDGSPTFSLRFDPTFAANLDPLGIQSSDVEPIALALPFDSTAVLLEMSKGAETLSRTVIPVKVLREALAHVEDRSLIGDPEATRSALVSRIDSLEDMLLEKALPDDIARGMSETWAELEASIVSDLEPETLLGLTRSQVRSAIEVLAPPIMELAEDPADLFRLELGGPDIVVGTEGERVTLEIPCVLAHGGSGVGAESWSLAVKVRGASITGISVSETAADEAPRGLRVGGSEASGVEEEAMGAYSQVALSDDASVVLPQRQRTTVAVLVLSAEIPAGGGDVWMSYADGVRASNGSVSNTVVSGGVEIRPLLGQKVVRLQVPPTPRAFRRGDCNGDGALDISDAVSTLTVLFLGDDAPGCDDACDSNDDGVVDVSDAISTLLVLFVGNNVMPPPGGSDCGVDPTEDELDCKESVCS